VTLAEVDEELVERLERPIAAFSVARLEELAALPGNPLQLEVRRFGAAVAPVSRARPDLDFVNRIEALGPSDAERLDEIVAFYGAARRRPWLELGPHLAGVGARLASMHAERVGFQAVLYGEPSTALVRAVRVEEADDFDIAARVALEANGVPTEVAQAESPALATAVRRLGGRFYLATIDGQRSAAAALTITDGVGYLALAATLPDFRRRGCQQALIAARLADSAAARCDLAVTTTELGSQSQRNLERAGLRIAYTKPILRLTPPG
jgi:ribosomal protein S18 acetylase RimI-like enzyme